MTGERSITDGVRSIAMTKVYDVGVVGAGPAGLATALAAAVSGFDVAMIGPRPMSEDRRTAALFGPSITFLERLGVWPRIRAAATPLATMRLVDATSALLRAPEVSFQAAEIDLEAFGYNIPNAVLTTALEDGVAALCTRIVTPAVTGAIETEGALALATVDRGDIRCRLVAAADGRRSLLREHAGISVSSWTYPQAAVVATLTHSRPHRNVSTEFHRNEGPLTVVPAPGNTSSLVWVETPARAAALAALDDAAFVSALSGHLKGLLGAITELTPRQSFPLSGQTADRLTGRRLALIGEAAHVIPPIGAQGLNLSFRDAATLADNLTAARRDGRDIAGADVLSGYEALRAGDIRSRVWGVDLLNRSLLSRHAPVQWARGFGIYALASFGPLRRAAMRAGLRPTGPLPELMRDPDAEHRSSSNVG